MVLRRLSPRELALVLPFHFLAAVAGASLIHCCFGGKTTRIISSNSSPLSLLLLEPITYSESNPWTVDFIREVGINAIFTIFILVVPELIKLNSGNHGIVLLLAMSILMVPLYSFGVDYNGLSSTFSPDIVYALRYVSRYEEVPLRQSSHLFGPIVGGLLGGKIMTIVFPDPPHSSSSSSSSCTTTTTNCGSGIGTGSGM